MAATVISELVRTASAQWSWIALRGVLGMALGLWAFFAPGLTLAALVIAWGAYALVDGVVTLIAAWRTRDAGGPFWSLVFVGVVGILAGAGTLVWPGLTALLLVTFIAGWAIAVGVLQIVAAIRLRKEIEGELWLIIAGAMSVLVGGYMLAAPGAGALALAWLIAAFTFLFGAMLLALAFRLRGLRTLLA